VSAYPFLSDPWFDAVRRIMSDHTVEVPESTTLRMNVVVTGTPFGEDRLLHVGAADGEADWGLGHLDAADLTLTTDYPTARELFVGADPQAAMQAFFEGRVKVQGDLTKLMAAQASGAGPGAPALAEALSRITE